MQGWQWIDDDDYLFPSTTTTKKKRMKNLVFTFFFFFILSFVVGGLVRGRKKKVGSVCRRGLTAVGPDTQTFCYIIQLFFFSLLLIVPPRMRLCHTHRGSSSSSGDDLISVEIYLSHFLDIDEREREREMISQINQMASLHLIESTFIF